MGEHRIKRVRHDTRRRLLTVDTVVRLTPHMVRIGFTSDDLAGFISLSFDDHIKLFFPAEDGGVEQMRDYTPRRFDVATGRLTIDFAVHDAGVATAWALRSATRARLSAVCLRVIPRDHDHRVEIRVPNQLVVKVGLLGLGSACRGTGCASASPSRAHPKRPFP